MSQELADSVIAALVSFFILGLNQLLGTSATVVLNTKVHATVDVLGNPTGFTLSSGPIHDLQGAELLLAQLLPIR